MAKIEKSNFLIFFKICDFFFKNGFTKRLRIIFLFSHICKVEILSLHMHFSNVKKYQKITVYSLFKDIKKDTHYSWHLNQRNTISNPQRHMSTYESFHFHFDFFFFFSLNIMIIVLYYLVFGLLYQHFLEFILTIHFSIFMPVIWEIFFLSLHGF